MNVVKKIYLFGVLISALFFLASCSDDEYAVDSELAYQNTDLKSLVTVSGDGDDLEEGVNCFSISYPISFTLPDGTTQEISSDEELELFIEQYDDDDEEGEDTEEDESEEDDMDDVDEPMINFPFSVELEDGTILEITNEEGLDALLEMCDVHDDDCDEEEDDDDDDDDDDGN